MESGWMTTILLVGVLLGPVTVFSKRVTCLNGPGRNIGVTCPRGDVIMNLKVKVGKSPVSPVSSKSCTSKPKKDCLGLTPEVVAQTNDCYFRNQCSIQLSPLMPITKSENRSCLARTPDYAILESWECVCEKSLKYVCDATETDQLVKKNEGRLVSHRSYPWFYPKHGSDRYCRVSFAQKPGFKLTLWSDDVDLDPDGHDNVSLYNVTSEASQAIGEPLRYSTQGFNETITSSTIQLVFFINQKTKAGRGFVINYKWVPIDSEGETTPGTDACKDEKSKDSNGNGKNRKNRGGKGNKGKRRRKGKGKKGKRKNKRKNSRSRASNSRKRDRKSRRLHKTKTPATKTDQF